MPSDQQRGPSPLTFSPEFYERMRQVAWSMLDTPEMRAVTDRLLATTEGLVEHQAEELFGSPAMDGFRERLEQLFTPILASVGDEDLKSAVPEAERLHRTVMAKLTGTGTLSAQVEIVADGVVSTGEDAEPAADSRSSRSTQSAKIDASDAALIVVALYSFLGDVVDDNAFEVTRNTLWSLALLLVVLMLRSPTTKK